MEEAPHVRLLDEVVDIFTGMGFSVAEGPEVELSEYNFTKLNHSADHPAREWQDTFYFTEDSSVLLRTQTSPVQIHVMEIQKPPIRVISPGRVYRKDEVDATHSPMFHQVEGLVVDKGITIGDLKGTLNTLVKRLYGPEARTRFRPHHFPFTEPSCEVDVQCFECRGAGCRVCKGEGWIEILGAGMVHPKVLEGCGIDTSVYSGFAFGVGLERLTAPFHISDSACCLNDLRFLRRFRRVSSRSFRNGCRFTDIRQSQEYSDAIRLGFQGRASRCLEPKFNVVAKVLPMSVIRIPTTFGYAPWTSARTRRFKLSRALRT